jgi:hypothetical protein
LSSWFVRITGAAVALVIGLAGGSWLDGVGNALLVDRPIGQCLKRATVIGLLISPAFLVWIVNQETAKNIALVKPITDVLASNTNRLIVGPLHHGGVR